MTTLGLGVGLAIAAMQPTRTTPPPAGADPRAVMPAGAGWSFLALPILAGTAGRVPAAMVYHRCISHQAYPA